MLRAIVTSRAETRARLSIRSLPWLIIWVGRHDSSALLARSGRRRNELEKKHPGARPALLAGDRYRYDSYRVPSFFECPRVFRQRSTWGHGRSG